METDVDFDTFVESGSSFVVTSSDGSTEGGSLDGDRLAIISDGVAFVFEK